MAAEGGKRVWLTCAFLQSFLKTWRQGERVKKGGSDQALREQAASPVNLPVIVFSWSSWERGSRPGPALPRPTPGGSAISKQHSLAAQHPRGGGWGAVLVVASMRSSCTQTRVCLPLPRHPLDAPTMCREAAASFLPCLSGPWGWGRLLPFCRQM